MGRDEAEKFAQPVVGLAVKGRSNQILLSFQVSKDFWFITLSPGSVCYAYGRLLIRGNRWSNLVFTNVQSFSWKSCVFCIELFIKSGFSYVEGLARSA